MIILKILAVASPILFLLLSPRMAAAAPCAGAAAGLVLWFIDSEEPPRFTAWAAWAFGLLIAFVKGAPALMLTGALPVVAFIALEYIEKQRGEGKLGSVPPLVAAIAVAAAGWLFLENTAPRGAIGTTPPQRIVTIGDSLTAGVQSDGVGKLWPQMLQEKLGQSTEVVSLAYPGDTAARSWERWRSVVQGRSWKGSEEWQPDLVIVLLGGNDIRASAGRDRVDADLRVWAEALNASGAEVLFVSVPGGVLGDSYAGLWREIAEEHGYHWMTEDALRKIFTSPEMKSDMIHFNQAGHEYFASAVYDRILGN